MRPLYLFLALGFAAVWVSCGGTDSSGLFVGGTGGLPGGGGNVTGGSGQTGSGGSVSSTGAGGGASGSTMTAGTGGAVGAAGKGGGGAGQGGAMGTAGRGGSAGMAGSATAGMGGGAGTLTVVDAGIDVHPVPDAGPRPMIRCGATSCDPSVEFCCLGDPRVCVPNGTLGCDRNRDRLHCDDASDCDPGQRCCVVDNNNGNPNDAVCRDTCPNTVGGRPAQTLCNPTAQQCPDSDPICSANGFSILPTYAFCH